MKRVVTLGAFLLSLAYSETMAGMVVTSVSKQGASMEEEVAYVENNRMIVKSRDSFFMMDAGKNVCYLGDAKRKAYWRGAPEELGGGGQQMMKEEMEKAMAGMSPEEKESFKQMMGKMMGMGKDPGKKPKVEVKKAGEKEKIAGYNAVKYQILVDGELKEEQWLSEELSLAAEIDMEKMLEMSKAMTKMTSGGGVTYKEDPAYLALMTKGLAMRTKTYAGGGAFVTEVVKVEKKKLGDSPFQVPEGYKEVSLREFLGGK